MAWPRRLRLRWVIVGALLVALVAAVVVAVPYVLQAEVIEIDVISARARLVAPPPRSRRPQAHGCPRRRDRDVRGLRALDRRSRVP